MLNRLTLCLALTYCLTLTATPLMAEANLDPAAPSQPGAVALYLSALTLRDLGQAAKDPLMVLTAARLLRGLSVTEAGRHPDPAPDQTQPLTPPDATALLTLARSLDPGDTYTDLIASVAREAGPAPRALRASAALLNPGQSQVWTLSFFGGVQAELAMAGHGNGNLDLLVNDDAGTIICQDNGNGDTALCAFTPARNGSFTVTITNPGTTPDAYLLITN